MTSFQRWNLTAAALLMGGIVMFVVCWLANLYNGLYVLSILSVAGFIGITAWKHDD